jgi:hypothetical protein
MDHHAAIITKFYTAFQQGDYATMQSCYHTEAMFHDPVFEDLDATKVKAMWQMLITSAKELRIEFGDVKTHGAKGSCRWQAWYPFSLTGRRVHNVIGAHLEFKDGLIFRHRDDFDFWRWSRQALGTSGVLLGWSPLVKNKVRSTAQHNLRRFIANSSF